MSNQWSTCLKSELPFFVLSTLCFRNYFFWLFSRYFTFRSIKLFCIYWVFDDVEFYHYNLRKPNAISKSLNLSKYFIQFSQWFLTIFFSRNVHVRYSMLFFFQVLVYLFTQYHLNMRYTIKYDIQSHCSVTINNSLIYQCRTKNISRGRD